MEYYDTVTREGFVFKLLKLLPSALCVYDDAHVWAELLPNDERGKFYVAAATY